MRPTKGTVARFRSLVAPDTRRLRLPVMVRSPRAERTREKSAVTPAARSVHTKKKAPLEPPMALWTPPPPPTHVENGNGQAERRDELVNITFGFIGYRSS